MINLRPHSGSETELFKKASEFISPCGTLLDVGPGIRPQALVECIQHICVEPHEEYAVALERSGFCVLRMTGNDALRTIENIDTVVALDVLEHMEKTDGEIFIKKARVKAKKQIVIFTTLGFQPQSYLEGEKDKWGLNGAKWQTHRSGWTPDDFDETWTCIVDRNFHGSNRGGFFAIHG